MKPNISDLWRWDGTLERGVYLFWGVCLFFIKFNLDRLIGVLGFSKPWTVFDWDTVRFYLWQSPPRQGEGTYFLALLAAALPFMWSGVVLTLRRLRSLGWQQWWVLFFFVPVLKLLFFTLLCLLPSKAESQTSPILAERRNGKLSALIQCGTLSSAALAVLISVILTILAAWLGTTMLGDYGWSLFVGLPFVIGFLSALIHSFHQSRSLRSCILTALVAVVLAGLVLFLVAMEGAICLIMAAPLAIGMSVAGGAVGYVVQSTVWRRKESARLFCVAVFLVPLAMELEHRVPPALPLLEVKSSVIVEAPPETVWRNVVTFSELAPPSELIFKLGVAYPIRAEIHGQGVGAIRYCNFSTGPFIEPIEVWEEPRLLKFSVTQNPEPMQEWSLYHNVHPRHLDGYLQSTGGQFRLIPLAGNRTLLEGTTWYYHHLWPVNYWQWWSDGIIHTIHLRVLNHVKELSEKGNS
ncbi:MAG: hypothetical protein WAO02_13170 [Verrucomicrobiia bacterium]